MYHIIGVNFGVYTLMNAVTIVDRTWGQKIENKEMIWITKHSYFNKHIFTLDMEKKNKDNQEVNCHQNGGQNEGNSRWVILKCIIKWFLSF